MTVNWQRGMNESGQEIFTSAGLRPERSSRGFLGSFMRAPLSRLGVVEDGSQESAAPAAPLAAHFQY